MILEDVTLAIACQNLAVGKLNDVWLGWWYLELTFRSAIRFPFLTSICLFYQYIFPPVWLAMKIRTAIRESACFSVVPTRRVGWIMNVCVQTTSNVTRADVNPASPLQPLLVALGSVKAPDVMSIRIA